MESPNESLDRAVDDQPSSAVAKRERDLEGNLREDDTLPDDGEAQSDDPADFEGDSTGDELKPDPATLRSVASMLESLAEEGLTNIASDYDELRDTIEHVKGIALSIEDLESAVLETERLRREREFVEREYGLSEADLPRGSRSRERALDATPWSDDYGSIRLQDAFSKLAEVLDRIGAQLGDDNAGADEVAGYPLLRTAFEQAVGEIEAAGEEPRKVAFTKQRLRAWLACESGKGVDFNALQRRIGQRMVRNLLITHATELERLARHHSDPIRVAPPPLRSLMKEIEALQNVLGGRAERLLELFPESERDVISKLAPALTSYADEISRVALSGAKALVTLPAANLEAQEEIREAPHFGTVFEASQQLPMDLSRIFTLHWIAESVVERGRRDHEGLRHASEEVVQRGRKTRSKVKITIGHVLHAAERRCDFQNRRLRRSVDARNEICHKGKIWDDGERFAKIISDYEDGISAFCTHFGVSPADIPVARQPRSCSIEEIEHRFADVLRQQGISGDLVNSEIDQEKLAKHLRYLSRHRPEFEYRDIRDILFGHTMSLLKQWDSGQVDDQLRRQGHRHLEKTYTWMKHNWFSANETERKEVREQYRQLEAALGEMAG